MRVQFIFIYKNKFFTEWFADVKFFIPDLSARKKLDSRRHTKKNVSKNCELLLIIFDFNEKNTFNDNV